MAKSLKEALLEKFSDLQELGIAPTTRPQEDEGPSVIVDVASDGRRDAGGRRARPNRQTEYEDESRRGGDVPIRPRSRPRRPERGEGRPGDRTRRPSERPTGGEGLAPVDAPRGDRPMGDRPMGGDRPPVGNRPPFGDRPPVGNRPPFGDRPPVGNRPPFNDRPPVGNRPPFADRPGDHPADRPFVGNRPPDRRPMGSAGPSQGQFGTTDRLRQRAEQRQREDQSRETLRGLLVGTTGGEVDDERMDKFFADLTVEVGALPPIERVVEAVQAANSAEPSKIGDQVRLLYRRPRPRPAPQG